MPSDQHKPLNPQALAYSAKLLAATVCVILAGCSSTAPVPVDNGRDTDIAVGLESPTQWLEPKTKAADHAPKDIWERLRSGYQLQDYISLNPRIEQQRLWFVSNPRFIESAGESSSPYIHFIIERLEQRNMPTELALLPMIESAYNPLALSHANAVGLWQFMPATGRNFNLRQTNFYDGRRDVMASTDAALNYLERLREMFNGDWLLALAAYNAGEGRVSRAIERNEKLGLPTDYWNLPLPAETQNYVPRLLALSQVVMSPQAYGVSLTPIANEPYFEKVEFKQRMDLARVAAMAELDKDELYLLNPAYKKGVTLDGPQHLLVPADKAELFAANLALMKPQDLVAWQPYQVRPGDSLNSIANRNQITVSALKDLNKLQSNHLRVGQQLTIPTQPGVAMREPLYQQRSASKPVASRNYKVKSGDNLWQIANDHNVTVKQIQSWNKLAGQRLRVGQVLKLTPGIATPAAPSGNNRAVASNAKNPRLNATYYRVRSGDSLYLIAKRFNVPLKSLQSWNPKAGKNLSPGQTLTLFKRQ